MGKAQTNASLLEITSLIQDWCDSNKLPAKITQDSIDNKYPKPISLQVTTQNILHKFWWEIQFADGKTLINFRLRLRVYFDIIIHAFLFVDLVCCTFLIKSIVEDYNYLQVGLFGLLAILEIIVIWWKDSSVSLKLIKIENSFWNVASKQIDLEFLTKADGSMHTKQSRLITEFLFAYFAVYLCSKLLGIYGFIISLLVCLLLLIMILAETAKKDNPNWHWRFWIIGNMAGWTFIMLQIIAIFVVLLATEIFMPLKQYNSVSETSILQAIQTAKLRDIKPATADNLERDCYGYFQDLAENDFKDSLKKSTLKIQNRLRSYGIVFFIIILIAVFFFAIRPFSSLLKKQKIWALEVCSKSKQAPFIPYISQSWQQKPPIGLDFLVLLHWVLGGIINIAVTILCIDGISYILMGKSLFFEKTANLWSWIFATCKICFTETSGQIVGSVIVVLICFPILCLLAAFFRRLISGLLFIIRALLCKVQKNETLLPIQNFLSNICNEYGLKKPVLMLTSKKGSIINLRHFLFGKIVFIEINSTTLKLLTTPELKAVAAHELGHLQQGLWQIETLKLLSSIAGFPNYYLTLFLNWAGNEIDADRFAIKVTNDSKSLKNALIKTATHQFSYMKTNKVNNTGFMTNLLNTINEKMYFVLISVKFYFGDRLLGYVHPYLSERLQAVDAQFTGEKNNAV